MTPCLVGKGPPARGWVMSRWSAVPRCPSGSTQALLRGPSPLPHGWLSRAVPASVGRSREQAVSRLRVPVPSGRGRLRRSGPPRPGTDRPAGHGKADASFDHVTPCSQNQFGRRCHLRGEWRRLRLLRGCPWLSARDRSGRCEWDANGTAGEDDLAHGGAMGSTLTVG